MSCRLVDVERLAAVSASTSAPRIGCQSLAAAIRINELNEQSQDPAGIIKLERTDAIACPVCGAATVQEKCKVICKSDLCRGRVVYNCAEF